MRSSPSAVLATTLLFASLAAELPTTLAFDAHHGHSHGPKRQSSARHLRNDRAQPVKRNTSAGGIGVGLGGGLGGGFGSGGGGDGPECYKLEDKWQGENFFDGWNFFNKRYVMIALN